MAWFWRRYTLMTREHYSSVIASQRDLYRAKACVDLCVVTALAAVAIAPAHPPTRYVDVLGSVTVAGYLLWSGLRSSPKPSPQRQGAASRPAEAAVKEVAPLATPSYFFPTTVIV